MKRKKSLKRTLEKIKEIKASTPKIIFTAQNIVVTLKNRTQLRRWLQLYPEGRYIINA